MTPTAWKGVKSGVEVASNGGMSAAEARLQQNSLRKASPEAEKDAEL
jgi:hypothetical protein